MDDCTDPIHRYNQARDLVNIGLYDKALQLYGTEDDVDKLTAIMNISSDMKTHGGIGWNQEMAFQSWAIKQGCIEVSNALTKAQAVLRDKLP